MVTIILRNCPDFSKFDNNFFYLQMYYKSMSNKFSGYFDQNFNFNNKVSPQPPSQDRLQNVICEGNIMLEPRLQEYLKKKRYYRDNQIEPCISAEKEFQISTSDLKILRSFLNGNKKIYNKKVYNKLVSTKEEKPSFPSSKFKDDKRVPKIEKSTQRFDIPPNRGMFVPDKHERHYDDVVKPDNKMLDARDFPEYVYQGNGFDSSAMRFNPRLDPKIDPGKEEKNKYESQFRVPPNPYKREERDSRQENNFDLYKGSPNDPRNRHIISDFSDNDFNDMGANYGSINDNDMSANYGSINDNDTHHTDDRYGRDTIPKYSMRSEMDVENKMVIPNISSSGKKELSTGLYRLNAPMAMDTTRQFRDCELESDLVRGMPSSRPKNKSYGYRS